MTRLLVHLIFAWLCLLVVASMQAVVPLGWGGFLAAPDVLLVVVLFVGLEARQDLGVTTAFGAVAGYLGDLSHGSPRGLHMLGYALLALAARGMAQRLLVRGLSATMLVALLASLGMGLLVAFLRSTVEPEVGWEPLRQVPMTALMTALAAPLLFVVLRRIERRAGRDPRTVGRP